MVYFGHRFKKKVFNLGAAVQTEWSQEGTARDLVMGVLCAKLLATFQSISQIGPSDSGLSEVQLPPSVREGHA